MKKTQINGLVFAVLSIIFGIVLIVLGCKEAAVDTSVPADEKVFDNMMLTVPGIVLILDSLVFAFRDKLFRSSAGFLIGNFAIVLLGGIIMEIVYFQFLYYGLSRPQYKLAFGGALIMLVYAVAILVVSAVFELTNRTMKQSGGAK